VTEDKPSTDEPQDEAAAQAAEAGETPKEAAPVDPLEEARAEAASLKDKLIRTAADFDNYRKRSRREVADAEKKGRDNLLNDLLPVFDNLERATAHGQSTAQSNDPATIKGLIDGIALVMKQFRDALGRLGIERVESVGHPFDPSIHEAIQHLETEQFQPGCVAAEVQPGYRAAERLIRPALVVVAKAPTKSDEVTTTETSSDESQEDAPPQSAGGESKGA
jgi:molecular chaperone GrpE